MMSEVSLTESSNQISVFESPKAIKSVEKLASPIPPPPVKTYQHNQQSQYEIEFPAGAMGLELEPVITSSERTIGCRVKDFYFGISYDGLDRDYLQEHVMIGDIIAKVNGTSVVSFPFNAILDMLRSLADKPRQIVFKNITASWESTYKGAHGDLTPAKPITRKEKNGNTKHSHWADAENEANALISKANKGDMPAALQQLLAKKAASKVSKTDPSQKRKESALSPKRSRDSKYLSISQSDTNQLAIATDTGSAKRAGNSRSLQKLLGCTVSPTPNNSESSPKDMNTANVSLASSGTDSPYRLRKPHQNESFTFSVQDIDNNNSMQSTGISFVSTNNTSANVAMGRASSESPSPRSKLKRSQSLTIDNPARLILSRATSGGNNRENACSSPLTPSSILRLKQQRSGTSSPGAFGSRTPRRTASLADLDVPSSAAAVTVGNTVAAQETRLINSDQSEHVFAHIVDRLRGTIGSGLVSVSNVLGARAEKALTETSHLLPVYSTVEMNQVMTKKHDLLNELSHSCMLLGEAKEREAYYATLQTTNQELETSVTELKSLLEEASQSKDSLQFKCKALETELSVLKTEKSQDNAVLAEIKAELARWKEIGQEQETQLSEADERFSECKTDNIRLRKELIKRHDEFKAQLQRVNDENIKLKENVETVSLKLRGAEFDRDGTVAELEVMKEMAASDKQSAVSEFARLREALASQQYLHKEQLVKHDTEVHELRRQLKEAQTGHSAIVELHQASEEEKAQLHTRLSEVSAEIQQLTTMCKTSQEEVKTAQEAYEAQKKLVIETQTQLKEQQAHLVESATEHGMLSDQARMAALTVTALHSEIHMLRCEIEEQRDIVKGKDLEILAAVSKHQLTEETLQTLRTDMEALEKNHKQYCNEKQEEINQLQSNIAAVREEHLEQAALMKHELVEKHEKSMQELQEQCEKLRECMKDIENEKKTLISAQTNVLQEREHDLVVARGQISDLESALAELKATHHSFSTDHTAIVQQSESEKVKLLGEVNTLKKAMQEVEEEYSSTIQSRENELSRVQSKISCLEDTLSQVRQEMNRLMADHKQKLVMKDNELVELAENRDHLKEKLESLGVSHREEMQTLQLRFETREKEFVSALSLAEDTQDSLRSDLHQQLLDSTKQCLDKEDQLKLLQEKFAEAEAANITASELVSNKDQASAILQSELDDTRSQISLLESKLALTTNSSQQSASQIAQLQEDLIIAKQSLASKTSELELLNKKIIQLQAINARSEQNHVDEIKELQVELNKKSTELVAQQRSRKLDQGRLASTLQGTMLELVHLRSSLTETKTEMGSLRKVHSSIVQSLVSQNHEIKSELSAVLSRQPGNLKLEGRLQQLLQEKEAASRRAAIAEQNTIDAESRCVNALTRAMSTEKQLAENKSLVLQLREEVSALEGNLAKSGTDKAVLEDAATLLNRKLQTSTEQHRVIQSQLAESTREADHVKSLLNEAQRREKAALKQAAEESQSLKAQLATIQHDREEHEKFASSSQAEQLATASRLQSQCSALQLQLDTTQQKLQSTEERHIVECGELHHKLQEEAVLYRTKLEVLEKQCADLKAQLESTESAVRSATTAAEQQLVSVQEEARTTCAELTAQHEKEMSELQIKLLTQERNLTSRMEEALTQSSAEKNLLIASHESQLQKAEKSHSEAILSLQQHYKLLIDELATEREHVEEQLESAQCQMALLRENLNSAEAANARLQAHSSEAASSAVSAEETIATLQSKLSTETSQYTTQITALTSKLDAASAEAQTLLSALQSKEGEITALQQVVMTHEQSLKELTAHQEGLETKLRKTQAADETIATLQSKLSTETSQYTTQITALTSKLDAASTETQTLLSALQSKEGEITALQQVVMTHEQSLKELTTHQEGLETKLRKTQAAEEAQRTAFLAAEALVTSLQTRITTQEEEYNVKCTEHKAMKEQLATAYEDLQRNQEQVTALNVKLTTEETQAAKYSGNVTAIMQDLEVSLERKKELKQQLDHAQLAQRGSEKQANILRAQVQELRDTLIMQQNVINEAEVREAEHNTNRRRLEQLVADGELRMNKLKAEYTQLVEQSERLKNKHTDVSNLHLQSELKKVTAFANQAQKALVAKCEELDSLHTHVTELLASTVSPLKTAQKAKRLADMEGESENILTERLIEQLQSLKEQCTAGAGVFEITETSERGTEWHGKLLNCSIHIYELLVEAFHILETGRESLSPNVTERLSALCLRLSYVQRRMHSLLTQTPWTPEGQAVPTLLSAHEAFRQPPAVKTTQSTAHPLNSGSVPVPAEVKAQTLSPDRLNKSVESADELKSQRTEKAWCSPVSGPVVRSVRMIDSGEDDGDNNLRASNDSVTLEELLSNLACNQSGTSSNNSSMCSAFQVHHSASTRRSGGSDKSDSLRNSTEDALSHATQVSAEIGEVSFDAFTDVCLGATPPSIKRIMRATNAARSHDSSGGGSGGTGSGNSKSSRRSRTTDTDESFDSVVSDLFNLSADTISGDSDDDSSLFFHYREK